MIGDNKHFRRNGGRTEESRRSLAKAATYRLLIMCLDFVTIYLFTGAIRVAFGFMVISNIYTTVGYFFHERLWARIQWGIKTDNGQLQ
jgi:uncharacterized membrane protein